MSALQTIRDRIALDVADVAALYGAYRAPWLAAGGTEYDLGDVISAAVDRRDRIAALARETASLAAGWGRIDPREQEQIGIDPMDDEEVRP